MGLQRCTRGGEENGRGKWCYEVRSTFIASIGTFEASCPVIHLLLTIFNLVRSMDDAKWPEPHQDAKQELEVILGDQHISFSVRYLFQRHTQGVAICLLPKRRRFGLIEANTEPNKYPPFCLLHLSLQQTIPIASSLEMKGAEDPKTLQQFHHLTQDLRCLVLPLISAHFKINPLGQQSTSFE